MEGISRTPFQGITNIIRFNWHYYVLALGMIVVMAIVHPYLPNHLRILITVLLILMTVSILTSLIASYFIYDRSDLYSLRWLDGLPAGPGKQLLNIHAGFDETSYTLQQKYPGHTLTVFDFYDPAKHTEISIERARKAYPAYPGTQTIETTHVPFPPGTANLIFLIFAAHEIRDHAERAWFFKQLHQALEPNGSIIVVEHKRDLPNFLAYNIGFLHFFSESTWRRTFTEAHLIVTNEIAINPFISAYTCKKDGTTP